MQWREGRAALWLTAAMLTWGSTLGCTAPRAAAAMPRLAVHLSAAQRQTTNQGPTTLARGRWDVIVRAELRFRAEPGAASRVWPAPSRYPL